MLVTRGILDLLFFLQKQSQCSSAFIERLLKKKENWVVQMQRQPFKMEDVDKIQHNSPMGIWSVATTTVWIDSKDCA